MIVMTAVTSHAPISSAGEPVSRAMSADTMKMPEPIIEPTTIAVALKRPRPCTSGGFRASCGDASLCSGPPDGSGFGLGVVAGVAVVTLQVVLPEKLKKVSS